MKTFDPVAYTVMVRSYQERDNPTGQFDSIYSDVQGDHRAVFWADLAPKPYLLAWLKEHFAETSRKRAIAIGCSVSDDA